MGMLVGYLWCVLLGTLIGYFAVQLTLCQRQDNYIKTLESWGNSKNNLIETLESWGNSKNNLIETQDKYLDFLNTRYIPHLRDWINYYQDRFGLEITDFATLEKKALEEIKDN